MMIRTKTLGFLIAVAGALAVPEARAQSPRARASLELGRGSLSLELGARSPRRERMGRYAPRRQYGSRLTWVSGHYENVERRVWVPGACRREWVAPVYESRCGYDGRPRQVLVRAGYWTTIQEPGHYVTRCEQVWVPGCWTNGRR